MSEVRLIDANTLHAKIMKDNDNDLSRKENIAQILLRIETEPTIEAEPVRHGRWIKQENGMNVCSACGVKRVSKFNFCGNCGAKMDADHIADVSKKVGGTENDDSM